MTDADDASGRLRSGRRFSSSNERDTNPPPPDESIPIQPTATNDRDTNPPPPDESEFSSTDVDDSQLSQSLLSVDAPGFQTIGRAHDGRSTTNLLDAAIQTIAPPVVPTQNAFSVLAHDDTDSLDDPPPDLVRTDAAPTHAIDQIFRDADATLAAATYDFELMSERLRLRLDHDLTAKMTTNIGSFQTDLGRSLQQSLSTFMTNIEQDIEKSTSSLKRDIKMMDERINQMSNHLRVETSSTMAAIETISTNNTKLAQETSNLSVRVVEHQSHLENLLGFEEARRQQMDDHVKQMGDLAALVADVKTNATVQTERVSAQLNGLRATVESQNTITTSNITDLRGRIMPDLREQSTTIAADVKRLEDRFGVLNDRFGSFDATKVITTLDDRLADFRAELDAFRKQSPGTHTTSRQETATTTDSLPQPRNPLFPNVDPTTFRPGSSWYVPPVSPPHASHDDPPLRPQPIDTSSPDHNAVLPMGGRITSPRATDKERQARKLHISRHDIAGLASQDYHGGKHGVTDLSISFIHTCGYRSFSPEIEDDVLPCYGSIQLLHKKVKSAWMNPRTLQSGPSVERILEKGLTVFPKLRGTTAREAVAFYESLQQVGTSYLLPIMPFDTVCLDNNYEGLFPPGLGTDTYCECCVAMLEVLPRLIPVGDYEIGAKLSSVRNSSRNGYDLLWRLLELFVPGFDPTIPIAQPVWTSDSSILDFCQGHMLYFRLQAKKNMFFSSRDRTTIFLRAVTPSEYADVVTSLQTSVDAYPHPDNDGILPDHLRIDGIATLIHNNTKHRVRDLHSPRINRVAGMDTIWDVSDDSELPYCHVQGYRPRALRLDGQRPSDGFRTRGDDGPRQRGGADRRNGARNTRPNPDKPQGRLTRPDQRRRAYQPGVQCDACKRLGHNAVNCDMLAIALYIDRYVKDITDNERANIESRWIDKWKAKLGQPARTPRQVMQTYCDNFNITPDDLDQAMDWDCWPDCDHDDPDHE